MTHASLVDSPLAVDPALLRLSVGLESEADLIGDLRQALEAAGT
jgi:cystathionine gamma-synthase